MQKLSTIAAVRYYLVPDLMFWLLCIADAFVYLVLKGLSNWTILFLTSVRAFTDMQASVAATCFEIGGIAGSVAAGVVSDMLGGRRNLAALSFTALTLPGLVILWFLPTPDKENNDNVDPLTLFVGFAALFELGFAINGPKTLCGIAAREMAHPHAAGIAGGLLGLAGQVGATISGYPLIALKESYGWFGVFGGLVGSTILSIILFAPLAANCDTGHRYSKSD